MHGAVKSLKKASSFYFILNVVLLPCQLLLCFVTIDEFKKCVLYLDDFTAVVKASVCFT